MCYTRDIVRQHLIAFNVIILIFAVVLLGVGSWVLSSSSNENADKQPAAKQQLSQSSSLVKAIAVACITIGCFSIVTILCGYYGTYKEEKRIIKTFGIMLLILLLFTVVCAFVSVIRQEWIQSVLRYSLRSEVSAKNESLAPILNYAYKKYSCCGVDNLNVCDINYPPSTYCKTGSPACQKGCLTSLWKNEFAPYLTAAGILLFLESGVLLYGIILTLCLSRTINDNGEYSYFGGS